MEKPIASMSLKDAGAKESAAMHDPVHRHNHLPHSISRRFSFLVCLYVNWGSHLAKLSHWPSCLHGSLAVQPWLSHHWQVRQYGNATSSALLNSAFLSERSRMILIPELKVATAQAPVSGESGLHYYRFPKTCCFPR